MVSISGSGTGYAAPTEALAAGTMQVRAAKWRASLLLAPLFLAANSDAIPPVAPSTATAGASAASLLVSFSGLRSAKGYLRACLTRDPRFFPNCDRDPHAMKESIVAGPQARLSFANLPSGDYALSVLHDENGNARADMLMGIPREGVGFSENPRLRFSAPKFDAARFRVGTSALSMDVRLQYFL